VPFAILPEPAASGTGSSAGKGAKAGRFSPGAVLPMARRMAGDLDVLGLEARAAWRMARALARAERAGSARLSLQLARAAEQLRGRGHDPEQAGSAALLLLAIGLRERGIDHVGVIERLRDRGEAVATRAALDSARVVRLTRPDLDPRRQEVLRRRVAVIVFLAFALWGAIGAHLFGRLN
jgi:hypothetical protein